jgi:hypothetical protein
MTRKETKTIQTWPGGASFEYRGDPDGPPKQRSLRAGHYQNRLRCAAHCARVTVPHDDTAPEASISSDDPRLGKYCVWSDDERRYLPAYAEICAQCNGEGYTKNPKRNPWRKGTKDEWRQIRIELRAEMYQRNYVQGCDSSLVDDLIKAADELGGDLGDGFGVDEIRNIYADPSDWGAEQCREYISDNGLDAPDLPQADCPDCEGSGTISEPSRPHTDDSDMPREMPCKTCGGSGEVANPDADEDDDYLEQLRDVCRDHAQDNPAEPLEWWRVDSWLCDQLHAIGEVTIDNGYGHWWGRQCSGQGFIMDGVLQQIAERFERDEE